MVHETPKGSWRLSSIALLCREHPFDLILHANLIDTPNNPKNKTTKGKTRQRQLMLAAHSRNIGRMRVVDRDKPGSF
jgi:hypothetical protein